MRKLTNYPCFPQGEPELCDGGVGAAREEPAPVHGDRVACGDRSLRPCKPRLLCCPVTR